MTENQTNQSTIEAQYSEDFKQMMTEALTSSGISLTAMKGFGKTRMLFSMASYLRSLPDSKVIIFDPSLAWLFSYSEIPVFNVNVEDITEKKQKTSLDVEEYQVNNWAIVKMALQKHDHILFRLKSRKPSIRGFFIRQVILYLDSIQRQEIEDLPTHKPQKQIAYFIEEFENAFSNRATLRNDSEEFLSFFNECRNMQESVFSCSQRETDCSKTIRVKQLQLYGRIPECDKSPYHRRLEKQYGINFSNLPLRNWVFNGKIIKSPDWKQENKPYVINQQIRAEYTQAPKLKKEHNTLRFFKYLLFPMLAKLEANNEAPTEDENEDNEDSQADGLMTLDEKDILFPEDF
jgi:hypothetical protein